MRLDAIPKIEASIVSLRQNLDLHVVNRSAFETETKAALNASAAAAAAASAAASTTSSLPSTDNTISDLLSRIAVLEKRDEGIPSLSVPPPIFPHKPVLESSTEVDVSYVDVSASVQDTSVEVKEDETFDMSASAQDTSVEVKAEETLETFFTSLVGSPSSPTIIEQRHVAPSSDKYANFQQVLESAEFKTKTNQSILSHASNQIVFDDDYDDDFDDQDADEEESNLHTSSNSAEVHVQTQDSEDGTQPDEQVSMAEDTPVQSFDDEEEVLTRYVPVCITEYMRVIVSNMFVCIL